MGEDAEMQHLLAKKVQFYEFQFRKDSCIINVMNDLPGIGLKKLYGKGE